ncbi:hypothetical protein DCAR_0935489 [Daucus carota subsp. sativus]|uniref:Uncharacterized protein n=1 Tax=Daucus carota subsp. sativus TaxID=79200 RepID=A0A175YIK3_DAUCS|nr:hypothetical protein DCAR_0935489 [Daucus carota subsp. sativus]
MDLLRHRLDAHQQQPGDVQAPVPPPPANNEVPGDDSSDDELVIILDPQPPLGEPVAVPPQGLPQNGPGVDGHAVNGPPQVQQPMENGAQNAAIQQANGHVANGAQD